jgi:hypothetical protein
MIRITGGVIRIRFFHDQLIELLDPSNRTRAFKFRKIVQLYPALLTFNND